MGNNGLGIFSAISGAAQGVGNMISQAVQNKRNRQFQQNMYNQQKADNIKFWEMENQYNSPIMQMQRLKDAGLNPNLVYGTGANAQGGSIQSPKQSASDQPAVQVQTPNMMDLYNMKKIDAQTALTEQSIKNQQANERLTTITTALQSLAVTAKTTENEFLRARLENEAKKLVADIGYTAEQTRTQKITQDSMQVGMRKTIQDTIFQAENQKWTVQQLAQNLANSVTMNNKMKSELGLTNAKITSEKLQQIEQKIINKFAAKGMRPGEHITSMAPKIAGDLLGDLLHSIMKLFK